jgi:lipoprotein NlpI
MKLDDWPKPIFSLYTGKLPPQELQKEAESWSDATDTAQRCDANFYLAEWYLARSDKVSATPLLVAAAQKCPIGYIERGAAESELKRLGVPVPKE